MSDTPTPYSPPAGMTLTTRREVLRLGLDWRWTVSSPGIRYAADDPNIFTGHQDQLVLAYPPAPKMATIDVKHLRQIRLMLTIAQSGNVVDNQAAFEALDAAIIQAGAERDSNESG